MVWHKHEPETVAVGTVLPGIPLARSEAPRAVPTDPELLTALALQSEARASDDPSDAYDDPTANLPWRPSLTSLTDPSSPWSYSDSSDRSTTPIAQAVADDLASRYLPTAPAENHASPGEAGAQLEAAAVAELAESRADCERLRETCLSLRQAIETAELAHAEDGRTIEELRAQVRCLDGNLSAAREQLDNAPTIEALSRVEGRAESLELQSRELGRALAAAQVELDDMRRGHQTDTAEYAQLRAERDELRVTVAALSDESKTAKLKLKATRTELRDAVERGTDLQQHLDTAFVDAGRAADTTRDLKAELEKSLARCTDLDSRNQALLGAQANLDRARADIATLVDELADSRKATRDALADAAQLDQALAQLQASCAQPEARSVGGVAVPLLDTTDSSSIPRLLRDLDSVPTAAAFVKLRRPSDLPRVRTALVEGWALQPIEYAEATEILLYRSDALGPITWPIRRWHRLVDLVAALLPDRVMDEAMVLKMRTDLPTSSELPPHIRQHLAARAMWRLVVPVESDAFVAFLLKESSEGKQLLANMALLLIAGRPYENISRALSELGFPAVGSSPRRAARTETVRPPTPAGTTQNPLVAPHGLVGPLSEPIGQRGSVVDPSVARAQRINQSLHFDPVKIAEIEAQSVRARAAFDALESEDDAPTALLNSPAEQPGELSAPLEELMLWLAMSEQHTLSDLHLEARRLGLGADQAVRTINDWADRAAERRGLDLQDGAIQVDNTTDSVWVDTTLGDLLT